MTGNNYPTWMLELKFEGRPLTEREQQLLRLLARGLTLGEAAEKMGTTRETAKTQIRIARAKLQARNIPHAVAIALCLELI